MEFETEILIQASAEAAWQVLGEQFGDIAQWSATLRSSSKKGELGVGCERTCEGVGFGPFPPGEVTETLTAFDDDAHRFTYKADAGLPWFVKQARNAWSVESVGPNECIVRSKATVELVWFLRPFGSLLPLLLAHDMEHFSDELRHRVETGKPHPRKLAMLSTALGG